MSEWCYCSWFFSVGDKADENTTIYVDEDNYIWLTGNESVKRVKTSINVNNVVELRYSEFGSNEGSFFVICNDDSGLDFCEGEIVFFKDGYYGRFKNVFEWFAENSVE